MRRLRIAIGVVRAAALIAAGLAGAARADTVALWLFDEQEGVYPGSVLNDAGPDRAFLNLGRGGRLEAGRFGRALRPVEPGPFAPAAAALDPEDAVAIGLRPPPARPGRGVEPMTWASATFAAALVHGETHLRGTPLLHPTAGRLNLGGGDFTIEFWLRADPTAQGEGVLLELGSGPHGGSEHVTRLSLHPAEARFELWNEPSGARLSLPTDAAALAAGGWVHHAFVYDAARGELRHYAGGRRQGEPVAGRLAPLPPGDEDYLSVGRDGRWERPLAGALDELRLSDAQVYAGDFAVPASFARHPGPAPALPEGPPLLFPDGRSPPRTIELGGRKHLFLDGALLARSDHVTFTAHPPRLEAAALAADPGWSTVVDDGEGGIRLYGECPGGTCVWLSRDGLRFEAPDLPGGRGNLVAADPARRASVLLDPNAGPAARWKLLGGSAERGLFLYTSPDGLAFERSDATALPFAAGSAPTLFYDDQRRLYVAHLRSDYGRTPAGATSRFAVRAETGDPLHAWPFAPASAAQRAAAARRMRLASEILDPWWLDNGPLAPAGPSLELPIAMAHDRELDPVATDLYNLRALKYPWAPDAYLAFPLWYFHYEHDGPAARQALAAPERGLGSGLVEAQLAVSRDGLRWTRHPRPAYVPVGDHAGYPIRRPYLASGMVRRGDEIWQYSYTRSSYHSPHGAAPHPPVLHRLVQRLDGFVSADAPYEREALLVTHPLRFAGGRLVLNVDTGATGYAQVGFLDERGQPVPGFGADDCVYVNASSVAHPVEWLGHGHDVSSLAGRTVQLVVRMRGAALYALQFVPAVEGEQAPEGNEAGASR
ncbi:MAG: hypothetical protein OZ948_13485 [Deltaproteobacteria bacterium]|nr:hypothetical protein [Deltaproteobacteria bacterium]